MPFKINYYLYSNVIHEEIEDILQYFKKLKNRMILFSTFQIFLSTMSIYTYFSEFNSRATWQAGLPTFRLKIEIKFITILRQITIEVK